MRLGQTRGKVGSDHGDEGGGRSRRRRGRCARVRSDGTIAAAGIGGRVSDGRMDVNQTSCDVVTERDGRSEMVVLSWLSSEVVEYKETRSDCHGIGREEAPSRETSKLLKRERGEVQKREATNDTETPETN